jgi:hypothetical protein
MNKNIIEDSEHSFPLVTHPNPPVPPTPLSNLFFEVPTKPKITIIKCGGYRFKKLAERFYLLKSRLALSIRVPNRFFKVGWRSVESCLNSIKNILNMRENPVRNRTKKPTKKQLLKQSKEMDERRKLKEWFEMPPDAEDEMFKVIMP